MARSFFQRSKDAAAGFVARIAINGVRGPIEVANRKYRLDMPPWGVLDDPSLAAIFTYLRREWGHTAAPVDAG